jgi:hypothetical protein
MKTAIVVLSDPKGGEDALGRVFNALALASDLERRREEVEVVFQGAGTRWTGVLGDADHPAHALFDAVKDEVVGASSGCAVVFGAQEDAERNGFDLVHDNPVPGTPGLASIARYLTEGWNVVTF